MYIKILIYIIALLYFFTVSVVFIKNKVLFKGLVTNALLGIIVLLVLKLLETFIKLKIYINYVTVMSAVLFGPIGVVFNLIFDYFFVNTPF